MAPVKPVALGIEIPFGTAPSRQSPSHGAPASDSSTSFAKIDMLVEKPNVKVQLTFIDPPDYSGADSSSIEAREYSLPQTTETTKFMLNAEA